MSQVCVQTETFFSSSDFIAAAMPRGCGDLRGRPSDFTSAQSPPPLLYYVLHLRATSWLILSEKVGIIDVSHTVQPHICGLLYIYTQNLGLPYNEDKPLTTV